MRPARAGVAPTPCGSGPIDGCDSVESSNETVATLDGFSLPIPAPLRDYSTLLNNNLVCLLSQFSNELRRTELEAAAPKLAPSVDLNSSMRYKTNKQNKAADEELSRLGCAGRVAVQRDGTR